ncbi:DNA polymerase III subunit gamma/tau [Candidatus Poribacteria bacterium]|nr:DNA polymerase III subunit gamma/tau [Candidatus Poribacteria bacterium]
MNCPNRQQETEFSQESTAEPCNNCQFCSEISQGRSFDVVEMDAASNRGIDPIRELRENTKLAPAACRYKIYIIDEAHMLTQEAFNALLKTLEEPPPHVIFILATTEHHRIPKTIVSRCQDFDFRYMEQDQIMGRLQEICEAEDVQIDTQGLSLIALQSEGCLRDAENLLERLTASIGKELNVDQINQILGFGSNHLINELIDAILQSDLPTALQSLDKLVKNGTDLTQCLYQQITSFRNLRLLAIGSNLENIIQTSKSELELMKGKAHLASPERLSRIIKILMRTSSEIKQHGYAQIHFESALIDACSIQEGLQLSKILKRLSEIEDKIDRGEAPSRTYVPPSSPDSTGEPPPRSSAPSPALEPSADSEIAENQTPKYSPQSSLETQIKSKPVSTDTYVDRDSVGQSHIKSAPADVQHLMSDSDELAKIWEELLVGLQDRGKMLLHRYLKSAMPQPSDEGEATPSSNGLELKVACPPAYTDLIDDAEKTLLKEMLADLLGTPVQISFVASSANPHANATLPPSRRSQEITPMMLRHQAERDPEVAPALKLFEAKILKIEPK